MLLFPMSFFCSGGFSFKWENVIFASYLRGRDMHIDFLRLLFLVGVICPLMQEHSLRLKKLISQALEDAKLKIRRPIYKRLFKSNRVLRADQKSVLNQTCSLHQDLMHRGCRGTTVPNVCLQALTLSLLSPRDFSPFPQTKSLFTG